MRAIYVDIDSLRPDHLGCYGYHRQTSPNIDALAKKSVRFENVYASDTPCLPSRTAFFLGQPGVQTGVVNHGGKYADLAPKLARGFQSSDANGSLAGCLRRKGIQTCSISPFPYRHSAYQMAFGFHQTWDTGRAGDENADEIWVPFERWIRANANSDNWFLHVNFWDPHTPYDTPADFGNPFESEDIESWITDELIARQLESFGPHSAAEVPGFDDLLPSVWRMGVGRITNRSDAKRHMDGYDTGIRYADHFVGKLLNLIDELALSEEVAVILGADHGENQGELNVWGDHQTADHCTNRLPFLIFWPGITDSYGGSVDHELRYHFDVSRSIIEWFGAEPLEHHCGRRIQFGSPGRDQLILSQGAWACQRSFRWDDWLLMRTYHTGLKNLPDRALFNLRDDPHELTNLAESRPDIVGDGQRRLDDWLGEQMAISPRGDPLWGVIQEGGPFHANRFSSEWGMYLNRLRSTGRSHHAAALESAQGRPF